MDNCKVIFERPHKKVYSDGVKVYKVFDETFSQSNVFNEALNQIRVQETGLPVPKVLEVVQRDGKWTIVMEYVKGKTLEELMAEHPDKADEYLDQMVDIQMDIHAKRAPHLNRLREKMHNAISGLKIDPSVRYELHSRLDAAPKHYKVCHGDLVPSNIIIDDAGKPHIIDWSHAVQGNGSSDTARTYLYFLMDGKKDIAESYLKKVCIKGDVAKQYIEQWLPVVAAVQLSRGIEGEADFLMPWLDAPKALCMQGFFFCKYQCCKNV